MGVVKGNDEGSDAFEHAMQGIRTSSEHRIVSVTRNDGLIRSSSIFDVVDVRDDTPEERVVIVKVRCLPPRRRR